MIADHDLSIKTNQIKKLISKNNSITLIMNIRGRLITNQEFFQEKFKNIIKVIEEENSLKIKSLKIKDRTFTAKF